MVGDFVGAGRGLALSLAAEAAFAVGAVRAIGSHRAIPAVPARKNGCVVRKAG